MIPTDLDEFLAQARLLVEDAKRLWPTYRSESFLVNAVIDTLFIAVLGIAGVQNLFLNWVFLIGIDLDGLLYYKTGRARFGWLLVMYGLIMSVALSTFLGFPLVPCTWWFGFFTAITAVRLVLAIFMERLLKSIEDLVRKLF